MTFPNQPDLSTSGSFIKITTGFRDPHGGVVLVGGAQLSASKSSS